MMEAVINGGTAGRVRTTWVSPPPPQAKPAPRHDAWFAGFTCNLLCIVWVGNDDYTDIKIEGAQRRRAHLGRVHEERRAAAPVLRHQGLHPARRASTIVNLDKDTNLLADAACPSDYTAAFLEAPPPPTPATIPPTSRNLFQKIFGLGENKSAPPLMPPNPNVVPPQPPNGQPHQGQVAEQNPNVQQKKKKRGFFGKVFGVFKGDDSQKQQPNPNQP